ncbi:hypothetical protein FA13DRAFT_1795642 [Coprinellus micaceus]|uniref:F-box domain-containing protein n=1 Tax=Coprinellus micaceus TaxID=71717 RepID=A0A4Y7SZ08_COPMI|nr:hypothetical protein FA13DRAFT_1795642 [Coprinellus micaceus]
MVPNLPDELWLLIFQEYISKAEGAWIPPESHSTTGPFVLSAVSANWRRICLSNWAIWSTIFISFPLYQRRNHLDGPTLDAEERFQAHIDALKLWIQRAGGSKLWLAYWMDEETFDFQSESAEQIAQIVVDNAPKIRKLNMWAFSECWYPLLSGVSFPVLERMEIAVPELVRFLDGGIAGRSLTEFTPLDLEKCPLLSSVDITGSPKLHSGIILPWTQIDDLTIRHVDLADITEVLDLMPNLRRCRFYLPWGYDEWEGGDAVEVLEENYAGQRRQGSKALEVLRIGDMIGMGVHALLGCVPLGLTHLEIDFNEQFQPDNDGSVLLPVLPFSDSLKILVIKGYTFGKGEADPIPSQHNQGEWDTLLDAFSKLSKLEELEVGLGEGSRTMDDATFARTFTLPGILPKLTRLRLGVPKLVSDQTLLDFLHYRRHSLLPQGASRDCTMIQEVVIVPETPHDLAAGTLAEIEILQRGGARANQVTELREEMGLRFCK